MRLVGGNDTSEGRLEIFHDGIWGTVCDDDWGTPGAEVVCNQLGFSGVKDGGVLVNFGPGDSPRRPAGPGRRSGGVNVRCLLPLCFQALARSGWMTWSAAAWRHN